MEGRLQLMASDQTKSRMDTISQSKEAGNNSFSSGDFKNATVSYSEAIQAYCQLIGQDIDPISQKYTKTTLTSIASAIISIASPITPTRDKSLASSSGTSPSQSLEDLQALARQVKPHILYSNRSASLGHLGQYEEALADSLKCIEAKPDWPKGYYRKGEALIGLLRFDEALPALYRALERYGENDKSSIDLINKRITYAVYGMQDRHRNFRIIQMLAGRDFAASTWSPISSLIFQFAKMMQNFVYAIACDLKKECYLVDVCWDVDGIIDHVQKLGYTVTGAIVTHYHFDHVGGMPPPPYDQYRIRVDGLEKLLKKLPQIKAYINFADIPEVLKANDISVERIEPTHDDFRINIGTSVEVKCLHTPGHTPGSQCLLVNGNRLLSGDTLFIKGIGRLDFPDCDIEAMYKSMGKLKSLEGDIMIYPGHEYGGAFTTLDAEKSENPSLLANNFNSFFVSATGG